MTPEPNVFLVDDDPGALRSLKFLLDGERFQSECFLSAEEFLAKVPPDRSGCAVIDLRMPGMDGLSLQRAMEDRRYFISVIIISAHADVPLCSQAFRDGAFDFLEKPVDQQVLLTRIREALAKSAERRTAQIAADELARRLRVLTAREREVLDHLVEGESSKQVAAALGISVQTVAKHRAKVLEKLSVPNDAAIVRLMLESGLAATGEA